MGLFTGYLLVSDVDGTLAPEFGDYPQRNLEAINFFKREGGLFTIATGRTLKSAQEVLRLIPITEPLILTNGSAVYDPLAEKFFYDWRLPPEAADYAVSFLKHSKLLTMRISLINGETYCVYVRPGAQYHPLIHSRYRQATTTIEQLSAQPWRKVLLILEPDDLQAWYVQLREAKLPGVEFTRTSAPFLEMLPAHASKGVGLRFVSDRLGFAREKVIAVGDYDNDLEMLQEAGLAACPANAVSTVKQVADWIVCDAKDGAIAGLIERLWNEMDRRSEECLPFALPV